MYPLAFLTRELSTNFSIPARFSDLRFPKEPFPLISEQWYIFFRPSDLSGKNAYSGATVTDFNRVPFSVIKYFFSKEQA
jgi:hypothetical protein